MEEGTVVAGRYRLIREIGRGSMGAVWHARHETLHTAVAIKVIHLEAARRARAVARFEREGRLVAQLSTQHVARVDDLGHHEGTPFIVMELLEGESLRERLDREGRLDVASTRLVLLHAARALDHAHARGLVHRDIKPANIFVSRIDGEPCVKLLDFGVCKVTDMLADDSVDPTRTGTLIGTPYYLSPEQAQGLKSVGPASDAWSLAVVGFECLTGRRPFTARAIGPLIARILHGEIPRLSDAAPDLKLPTELNAWLSIALSRAPEQRFTAMAMAGAFEDAIRGAVPHVDGATLGLRESHGGRDPTLVFAESERTLVLTSEDNLVAPAPALPFENAPVDEDTPPATGSSSLSARTGIFVGIGLGLVVAVLIAAFAQIY